MAATDAPPQGAVVLINPFRVPQEEREAFLAHYRETMARLHTQPGFLGGGLHELAQPVHPGAFDFVNVNHWRSAEEFHRGIAAANPDAIFGGQVQRLEAHPGLFQVLDRYGSWRP